MSSARTRVGRSPDSRTRTRQSCGGVAVEPDDHSNAEAVDIRCPAKLRDGNLRKRLQPDRLPDAGGPVIPDIARLLLPVLLAARLLQIPWLVLGADDDRLDVAGNEQGSDVG